MKEKQKPYHFLFYILPIILILILTIYIIFFTSFISNLSLNIIFSLVFLYGLLFLPIFLLKSQFLFDSRQGFAFFLIFVLVLFPFLGFYIWDRYSGGLLSKSNLSVEEIGKIGTSTPMFGHIGAHGTPGNYMGMSIFRTFISFSLSGMLINSIFHFIKKKNSFTKIITFIFLGIIIDIILVLVLGNIFIKLWKL